MHRSAAAVILLGLAFRASADEPALAACAGGDTARVMIGHAGPDGPVLDSIVVRRPEGRWSPPAPLPAPTAGLPFVHRSVHWFLQARRELSGRPYHVLIPSTGELGVDGSRMECLADLRGFAVTAIDDWTFCVVDLGAHGGLHARRIESKGSLVEMDVEGETVWSPGWPDGTTLLAGGMAGSSFVAVAALPGGGLAATEAPAPESAAELPPPPLPPGRLAAACVTRDGPVIAVVPETGTQLLAVAWTGAAWCKPSALELPAGMAVRALTATPLGDGGDRAVIAALAESEGRSEILAARWSGGSFGALERRPLDAGATPPPARDARGAAGPAQAERAVARLRIVRWATAAAGAAALVWLLRKLAATRS